MTFSAKGAPAENHSLDGALDLYRDLSLALRAAIKRVRSDLGDEPEGPSKLLQAHWKSLQSVLDIEASLGKRSGSWADRAGRELDLDAARAEILERLVVWATET
jgi:hypothetical protein